MACHENNRYLGVFLIQFGLKVEPAQARKPDIQDQATWRVWPLPFQEFRYGGKHFGLKADRSKKIRDGLTHELVIIDDYYDGLLVATLFINWPLAMRHERLTRDRRATPKAAPHGIR